MECALSYKLFFVTIYFSKIILSQTCDNLFFKNYFVTTFWSRVSFEWEGFPGTVTISAEQLFLALMVAASPG